MTIQAIISVDGLRVPIDATDVSVNQLVILSNFNQLTITQYVRTPSH